MLLNRGATAQRVLTKAPLRLIERRVEACRVRRCGLEERQLGCGAQITQDHAQQPKFRPACSASQRPRRSFATLAMVRPSCVGGATARCRVEVVKSARRILTPTHPLIRRFLRRRSQASSAMRASCARRRALSAMSMSKVSSALRDCSSRSTRTGDHRSRPHAGARVPCSGQTTATEWHRRPRADQQMCGCLMLPRARPSYVRGPAGGAPTAGRVFRAPARGGRR
jgi:hypothetical protein